MKENTTPATN